MRLPHLWFLIAGLGAALALVPLARRLSVAVGMVAEPQSDRWHRRPVAKLGGVAMGAAFVAVLPFTGGLAHFWPLLLCTGLMWGLGLIDDLRPVRPTTKLLGQVLIAALLLYLLPPLTLTGHVIVDHAVAFFWLVGLTNAFNLLDNIDGLAAGVGAISSVFLAITLASAVDPALAPLSFTLWAFAGTSLGFLRFNFQPASIFMGDSGSHLLGFFISGAALVAVPYLDGVAFWPAIIGPIITLLIPIFDTAFVTITRGLAGRGVFQGGRDHTSHRLVALGITERRAVLVLYALAIVGGLIGLTFHLETRLAWGIAALYGTVLAGLGVYLGHLDAARQDAAPGVTLLPSELTNRYRAYEIAFDGLIIGAAYYLALSLRFAEPEFTTFLPYFRQSLPLVLATQLGGLAMAGKYRQVWRTFGAPEAAALLRGIGLGVAGTIVALLYLYRFEGFSRTVFLVDAALLTAFLITGRAALSAMDDYLRRQRADGRVALIIGAGRGGALAVRELLQNPELGLVPCGFLDDDAAKQRSRIDGYRVLGTLDDLPRLLATTSPRIAAVVIAIKDLPADRTEALLRACDVEAIPVRRLRLSLEDSDWRDRTPGVVRFPDR